MPLSPSAPRAGSPSSLVGEILGDHFALLEEVGPDGTGVRYIAFDTLAQHRIEIRVLAPQSPGAPYRVELAGTAPAAAPHENTTPAAPAPLKRIRGAVSMAEASPLADSPPQSSATDRRASAPPADFDPEESDWFAEGDTLAEQPTLAWEEADVCSRPRIAAVRQSKGPETAERRYKLSWASAWVED